MASKKTNKKLPKDAVSEQEIDPLYGFVHGEWNAVGGHHMSYCNPDEHEKYYHEEMHASCSYVTTQHDKEDKEINTSMKPGEVRGYIAGSHSHQVDVHSDLNVEKTMRTERGGDGSDAYGRNRIHGVKGKTVKVLGEHTAQMTSKSSEVPISRGHTGTVRQDDEKDNYHHIQGNHSVMNEKSHAHVVGEEWADYAGGNYDFRGEKKYHVYSKDAFIANTDSTFNTWSKQDMTMETDAKGNFKSKSDMTIESDSKITIKVGGSSVVIESGSITIKSAQIKFEQG